jgi:hypothetical protein
MSKFIEGYKDAVGSAAVEAHFSGANVGQRPGTDGLLRRAPYGTPDWNSQVGGANEQTGLQNTAGTVGGKSMFNVPGQSMPREIGVNYKPQRNAGHSLKDDPFSLGDGFPGN